MKRALPMIFLIIFESIADIFAKKRSDSQFFWYSVIALGFYLICNTFRLFALKNWSWLGRGAIIFSVASGILALAIWIIMFKESFTPIQIIWVILGLASIILVSI